MLTIQIKSPVFYLNRYKDWIFSTVPVTVTLQSSDPTRKIEFSTNGGIEYFEPEIDVTTPTMIITHYDAPITDIKITGAIGDTVVMVN